MVCGSGSQRMGYGLTPLFSAQGLWGSGSNAPRSKRTVCGSGLQSRPTSSQQWPWSPRERPVCGGTFAS